jgi:hypothetical protein
MLNFPRELCSTTHDDLPTHKLWLEGLHIVKQVRVFNGQDPAPSLYGSLLWAYPEWRLPYCDFAITQVMFWNPYDVRT